MFYHAQYSALATIQTNSKLTSLAKVSFLKHPSLPFVSIEECDVHKAVRPGGKCNYWAWEEHFPKGVLGMALWRSQSHLWQGHWAELKPQGKMSVSNRIHFGDHIAPFCCQQWCLVALRSIYWQSVFNGLERLAFGMESHRPRTLLAAVLRVRKRLGAQSPAVGDQ